MTDYFDKRKKQKLYQQWVENSGLPPESVPSDLNHRDDFNESENVNSEKRWLGIQSGLTLHLTTRHFLYLVLIIIALLITTASLATILVMRSC